MISNKSKKLRPMMLFSRINLQVSIAAIIIITINAGVVRADVVAVKDKPLAVGVKLIELRDGQLFYRLPAGRLVQRPLEHIEYLQVTGWKLFNLAEKQQRDGYLRESAGSYERLLESLTSGRSSPTKVNGDKTRRPKGEISSTPGSDRLERELLVQCRLLRVYDRQGRFDKAVEIYLKIIEVMPACLEILRPAKPPAAGSTFLQSASAMVDSAIDQHGQDAISLSLSKWRKTWPVHRRTDDAEIEYAETNNADSSASRLKESPRIQQVRTALTQIRSLVEADKFEEALQKIASLQDFSTGRFRADLYYWQGRAWLGKSDREPGPEASSDRRRAGLAFMRVAIHFPRNALAAECLYRAAEICQRTGHPEQAVILEQELIQSYPALGSWAERVRQKLTDMQSSASAPGS